MPKNLENLGILPDDNNHLGIQATSDSVSIDLITRGTKLLFTVFSFRVYYEVLYS